MAKTFKDITGQVIKIDPDYIDFDFDTDEDIVTGEISGYFILVNERPLEVDEDTYKAVRKHLKK